MLVIIWILHILWWCCNEAPWTCLDLISDHHITNFLCRPSLVALHVSTKGQAQIPVANWVPCDVPQWLNSLLVFNIITFWHAEHSRYRMPSCWTAVSFTQSTARIVRRQSCATFVLFGLHENQGRHCAEQLKCCSWCQRHFSWPQTSLTDS